MTARYGARPASPPSCGISFSYRGHSHPNTPAVTAFLAYSGAVWPQSIWYRRSWVVSLKSTIDGLIYGCVTAGVFGWLWPR